jgi:hypothetical protein
MEKGKEVPKGVEAELTGLERGKLRVLVVGVGRGDEEEGTTRLARWRG